MEPSKRLQTVPLFSALTEESLARVTAITRERSYPRGTFIHRQDELGHALFVIQEGEAVLHQTDLRGTQRPIGYLSEGSVTGETALLLADPYGSFAQATTDVNLLTIEKEDWDQLLQDHAGIETELTLSSSVRERLKARSYQWPSEDEPPILLRKRHWIVFAATLPLPLITALALGFAVWLLTSLGVSLTPLLQVLLVGTIPLLMIVWFYADWQNDYFLLTAKRLLHREKVILLYETWEEVPLSRIQNTEIHSELGGHVLGFGTLRVQTAGRGTLILDHIPDPFGFQQALYLHNVYLRSRALQDERDQIREQYQQQKDQAEGAPLIPPFSPTPIQQRVVKRGWLARLFSTHTHLPGEQTMMVIWHKHWAFLLRKTILPLVAVVVIIVMITISVLHRNDWYSPSLLLTSLVLWIVAVFWLWWEFEDWRNDIYMVTNRLIIDVEKKPLFFDEKRKQAPLDAIQNVSLRQRGLIAYLLNYGDVLIQTAGTSGDFAFNGVASPTEVQREVFRRIEAYEDERHRRQRAQKTAEFVAWFQAHNEFDHTQHSQAAE
jgi:uncharacterized membrane protein YdbT with pleckstrin-like domain